MKVESACWLLFVMIQQYDTVQYQDGNTNTNIQSQALMIELPDLLKMLPATTSSLATKLSLVQLIYVKYRKLKDEITNKQIEYMLANDGIMSGQLQPNPQAYVREYNTIMKQSRQAQALLQENLETIEQIEAVLDEARQIVEGKDTHDDRGSDSDDSNTENGQNNSQSTSKLTVSQASRKLQQHDGDDGDDGDDDDRVSSNKQQQTSQFAKCIYQISEQNSQQEQKTKSISKPKTQSKIKPKSKSIGKPKSKQNNKEKLSKSTNIQSKTQPIC